MVKRADGPPPRVPTSVQRKLPGGKAEQSKPAVTPKGTPPKKETAARAERMVEQELASKPDDPIPEDLQAVFGENLRAARLKSGLKQSDVAERTGLTQQRLSKIENGRLNLTLKTMMRLAAVVDHNVSAMLSKVKAKQSKK